LHAAAKSPRAKILKLADKTSNLRSLIKSPPADWSVERKREYLEWAKQVASGLRGANRWLEARFDEAFEQLHKGRCDSYKTVDIHLRPIFHWTAPRVRAHVFLCMLAYHLEHHMRARLAPMLYDETDHEAAAAMRTSIVAKAERSDAARRKQTTGRTADGLPVHSFRSLLADLATYCRIQATTALNEKSVFTLHTRPTPIQSRAFELLATNPDRTQ
jgi:hypothetical protein